MLKHVVMNAVISRHAKAKQISRAGCNISRETMCWLSWITVYFVLKETFQLWILSLAPRFVE